MVKSEFDTAAHEKALQANFDLHQQEIKIADGSLTPEQVSVMVNHSRSAGETGNGAKAEEKRRTRQTLTNLMLDDISKRLDELEASMAKRFTALQNIYGDDVIGGMADTFLSEEEREGLETDEEKLRALADKFLDKNGKIKKEYQHLEEAKYVRDWNEAQQLSPVVAKYEGRNSLTTEETAEVFETAKILSNVDAENLHLQSDNDQLKDTVEQVIDTERSNQELAKADATLNFAKPS